jgi:hypothetical protein
VRFCVWTGLSRAEAGSGATRGVCVCVGGLSMHAFLCVDRIKQMCVQGETFYINALLKIRLQSHILSRCGVPGATTCIWG